MTAPTPDPFDPPDNDLTALKVLLGDLLGPICHIRRREQEEAARVAGAGK